MSRMACIENIYDTLTDAGLNPEHSSFDDLVQGCAALAVDPVEQGRDIVCIIADWDDSRTETEIALDIKDFAYQCGYRDQVVGLIARAAAAGKAGWSQ